MNTKSTLTSALFALAFSTAVVSTGVNAADNEIILHNAMDDYSGMDIGTFKDGLTSSRGRYDVKTILDESYHDYNGEEVVAFQKDNESFEQAELAAFETSFFNVPWELSAVD